VAVINRSIARRYARALFDLVESDPSGTAEKLQAFADLIAGDPTLAQVLSSPMFAMAERQQVLKQVLAKLGWGAPLTRFFELLVERHRMVHIQAVAESFSDMVDEREGRLRVTVESAVDLDDEALARLKKALAEGLSKQIIMKKQTDSNLLAGMAVRLGGVIVDGSLKSQLARLKEELARSQA
jgi:F-type H+-transporting ATPase subunit delta